MADADLLKVATNLVRSEEWVKAWQLLNTLLNEDPESPEVLYLLGIVLRAQGHVGLALPAFSKALAKNQQQPNIWMNFGACLHDLTRHDEAINAFSIVSGMVPGDPMPIANISAAYVEMGKWRDTITWADKALAIDPNHYIAHISKSFANLGLGRWKDAWQHAEYLYGNHLTIKVYNDKENEEPLWDGSAGKTVVVQADQGVGNIIMFSQCLPQLQADCKEVIVECSERMVPYFKRNFPGIHVYGTLKDAGQAWSHDHKIEAHTHISFLGKWYRNTDKDFPRKAYITPDPELVEKWSKWLEKFERPWKGIAWRGGIFTTKKHVRSVTLADWKPVIDTPGTSFDLSYHDSKNEVDRFNAASPFMVERPPIDVGNFDDTIAFIAAMDKVFTVTTTVAHVCGALGRTANVIVPEVPTWRYAYHVDGGERMIWYPPNSVRLFRRKPGELDWSFCINRAVKASR